MELVIDDYEELLKQKGQVMGFVKTVSQEDFGIDILKEYRKYLLDTKVIIIKIEVSKGHVLSQINDFLDNIYDDCAEDTSLSFDVIEKESETNEIVFKMLMSGIN